MTQSSAVRPAWMTDLLAEVDERFAVTGADTPGWPDPHPDRRPLDAEYSRVSDPGKYRIIDARVEAWLDVLTRRGLATHRVLGDPEPWTGEVRPPAGWARVRRVDPVRAGGLSLLLADTGDLGNLFGLDVAIADADGPPVLVGLVPDCGCDACDSGSADLLTVVDEQVLVVVRGGVLHARTADRSATRTLDGSSASGRPTLVGDEHEWLDEAADPEGVRRWVGESWLPG